MDLNLESLDGIQIGYSAVDAFIYKHVLWLNKLTRG